MTRSYAYAVGGFDGVHRGHRQLVRRLVRGAKRRGLVPAALVLDGKPAGAPRLLDPGRQEAALRRLGVRKVVRLALTAARRAWSPARFVAELTGPDYRARLLAAGANFRFGRGRRGDAAALARLAARRGCRTEIVPVLAWKGAPVSSSRIRDCVRRGDLATAARLLGRPHRVAGRVVPGLRRGRELGCATANLAVGDAVLPPPGVYLVRLEHGRPARWGVASWGTRPTFRDDRRGALLEVHLLDWSGDLYGRELAVEFAVRLRAERAFPDAAALAAAMQDDLRRARLLVPSRARS